MTPPESKRPAPQFEKLDPPKVSRPLRPGQFGAASTVPTANMPSVAPPISTSASPGQHAVAISYQARSGVPRVVAKGRGQVAQQIISRARDAGVAVHQSKELVALLMQVELDDQIPPALYRAVAELLAWLYQIEASRKGPGKVS